MGKKSHSSSRLRRLKKAPRRRQLQIENLEQKLPLSATIASAEDISNTSAIYADANLPEPQLWDNLSLVAYSASASQEVPVQAAALSGTPTVAETNFDAGNTLTVTTGGTPGWRSSDWTAWVGTPEFQNGNVETPTAATKMSADVHIGTSNTKAIVHIHLDSGGGYAQFAGAPLQSLVPGDNVLRFNGLASGVNTLNLVAQVDGTVMDDLVIQTPEFESIPFSPGAFGLVLNGDAAASIFAKEDDLSPSEETALQEIQTFVKEMSWDNLPVYTTETDAEASYNRQIVLGYDAAVAAHSSLQAELDALGDEGFLIREIDGGGGNTHLVIAGGKLRGTMYGVYTFLEDLGVHWPAPDMTVTPDLTTLEAQGNYDKSETPVMTQRNVLFGSHQNETWLARNKVNAKAWATIGEKYGEDFRVSIDPAAGSGLKNDAQGIETKWLGAWVATDTANWGIDLSNETAEFQAGKGMTRTFDYNYNSTSFAFNGVTLSINVSNYGDSAGDLGYLEINGTQHYFKASDLASGGLFTVNLGDNVTGQANLRLQAIEDITIDNISFKASNAPTPANPIGHEGFAEEVRAHNLHELIETSGHAITDDMKAWSSWTDPTARLEEHYNMTNDDVIAALTTSLVRMAKFNPGAGYVHIFQMDNTTGFSRDDDSLAQDVLSGSTNISDGDGYRTGQWLHGVNRIAKNLDAQVPGYKIMTGGYLWTEQPVSAAWVTANGGLSDNLMIQFAPIHSNYMRPLAEAHVTENQETLSNLQGWGSLLLDENLMVWDYVVDFYHYEMPYANLDVLVPNARTYADNGVTQMMVEGSHKTNSAEFDNMRAWILARAMWNPTPDASQSADAYNQELITEYLDMYYGAAAPKIQEYIDIMHEENRLVSEGGTDQTFEQDTYAYMDLHYLTPERMGRAEVVMRQAEELVAGSTDATLIERVRVAHLPVLYVIANHNPDSSIWNTVNTSVAEATGLTDRSAIDLGDIAQRVRSLVDTHTQANGLTLFQKAQTIPYTHHIDPDFNELAGGWIDWLEDYAVLIAQGNDNHLPAELQGKDPSTYIYVPGGQLDVESRFISPIAGATDGWGHHIFTSGWINFRRLNNIKDFDATKTYTLKARIKPSFIDATAPSTSHAATIGILDVHGKGPSKAKHLLGSNILKSDITDFNWRTVEVGEFDGSIAEQIQIYFASGAHGGNNVMNYYLGGFWLEESGTSAAPTVSVTVQDGDIQEEDANPGTFRITRAGTSGSLTVNYAIDGTATAGNDYTNNLSGSATIVNGQDHVDIVVTPVDDAEDENNETVTITITPDAAYNINTGLGSMSIIDNDGTTTPGGVIASDDFNDGNLTGLDTTTAWTSTQWYNYGGSVSVTSGAVVFDAASQISTTFDPGSKSDVTLTFDVSGFSGTSDGYISINNAWPPAYYIASNGSHSVDLTGLSGNVDIKIVSPNGGSGMTLDNVQLLTGDPPVGGNAIATDDFNANNGTGGTGAWVGAWSGTADFSGGDASFASSQYITRSLDLTGYANAQLVFDVSGFGNDTGDLAYISVNGGASDYFLASELVDGQLTVDLSSYSGVISIKIGSDWDSVLTLDNLTVTGTSL